MNTPSSVNDLRVPHSRPRPGLCSHHARSRPRQQRAGHAQKRVERGRISPPSLPSHLHFPPTTLSPDLFVANSSSSLFEISQTNLTSRSSTSFPESCTHQNSCSLTFEPPFPSPINIPDSPSSLVSSCSFLDPPLIVHPSFETMRHPSKQDVDTAVPLPPGYVWAADCLEQWRSPPTQLTIIFRKTLVFGMPKPDNWDAMDHATQMKSKRGLSPSPSALYPLSHTNLLPRLLVPSMGRGQLHIRRRSGVATQVPRPYTS